MELEVDSCMLVRGRRGGIVTPSRELLRRGVEEGSGIEEVWMVATGSGV